MAVATAQRPRDALDDIVVAQRPPGAVKAWALLGAVVLVTLLVTAARWIASDHFDPSPTGADHYEYLLTLRIVEVASVLFLLGMLVRCVVLPWRRDRSVGFDGKLLIGCLCVHFIDPVFNYFSPSFIQNAHSVNAGSWSDFLPGFASPAGDAHFVEGVLWAAALYGVFGVAAAIAGCWLLDRLRARLPRASNLSLYTVLFAIFSIADLIIENFFVRTEIYIFWGAWSPLTLWAGETYQFPIYETILAVTYALGFVWLRDSRDEHGHSWVERGLSRVRASGPVRWAMSFCAIVGFSLMWGMASYFGWFMALSMKSDAFPQTPSYLQGGAFCGLEGKDPCPAQYLRALNERYEHDR